MSRLSWNFGDGPLLKLPVSCNTRHQIHQRHRVRALLERERVLVPVAADAERDHAAVPGEVHPIDHERDQVDLVERGGE